MTLTPARKPVPAWLMAAGIAVLFLGVVGFAKVTGHWDTNVPDWLYTELIPKARELGHP